MGLKEDALQAANDDRAGTKREGEAALSDATNELREKFDEWCADIGIERPPSLNISNQRYDESTGFVPQMDFRTIVDDIELKGHFVSDEKLQVMHGDREVNTLADLGRAVRAENRAE